jgi:hypothetical protein
MAWGSLSIQQVNPWRQNLLSTKTKRNHPVATERFRRIPLDLSHPFSNRLRVDGSVIEVTLCGDSGLPTHGEYNKKSLYPSFFWKHTGFLMETIILK